MRLKSELKAQVRAQEDTGACPTSSFDLSPKSELKASHASARRRKAELKSELGHAAVGVLGFRLTELKHAIGLAELN